MGVSPSLWKHMVRRLPVVSIKWWYWDLTRDFDLLLFFPILIIGYLFRYQIFSWCWMWEGDLHIVVCHARLGLCPVCRGQSRCRIAINHTQCQGTRGRARLLSRSVVARSYRRCCVGSGIHRTCRKELSTKLPHSISKGGIGLCHAFELGRMASCRSP